jgi:hypothetical protein
MHTPGAITKRCLRDAFAAHLDGFGFSFVEILTMCSTDWYVEPTDTPWVEQHFAPTYPLRSDQAGLARARVSDINIEFTGPQLVLVLLFIGWPGLVFGGVAGGLVWRRHPIPGP